MVRRRIALASIALLASVSFLSLAASVAHRGGLVDRFDHTVHTSVRDYGLTHPTWLSVMHSITHVGDTATIAAVDAAVVVLCLWRSRRRAAAFVAVTAFAVWALRIGVRTLIARPRPDDPLWSAEGFSFPSGHTTNTAAMTALVVVACWPLLRRGGRIVAVTAAGIVTLAVGLSRVVGGVHWPSDIAGGLLLATAIICAAGALSAGPASSQSPGDRSERDMGVAAG